MACGSLLGAMRDGDVIPYDSDIDVLVEHSYFSILERLSVKRDFNPSDGKIRLVVQPEFALNISIDKRRMFNCEGKVGTRWRGGGVTQQILYGPEVQPLTEKGTPFVLAFY